MKLKVCEDLAGRILLVSALAMFSVTLAHEVLVNHLCTIIAEYLNKKQQFSC